MLKSRFLRKKAFANDPSLVSDEELRPWTINRSLEEDIKDMNATLNDTIGGMAPYGGGRGNSEIDSKPPQVIEFEKILTRASWFREIDDPNFLDILQIESDEEGEPETNIDISPTSEPQISNMDFEPIPQRTMKNLNRSKSAGSTRPQTATSLTNIPPSLAQFLPLNPFLSNQNQSPFSQVNSARSEPSDNNKHKLPSPHPSFSSPTSSSSLKANPLQFPSHKPSERLRSAPSGGRDRDRKGQVKEKGVPPSPSHHPYPSPSHHPYPSPSLSHQDRFLKENLNRTGPRIGVSGRGLSVDQKDQSRPPPSPTPLPPSHSPSSPHPSLPPHSFFVHLSNPHSPISPSPSSPSILNSRAREERGDQTRAREEGRGDQKEIESPRCQGEKGRMAREMGDRVRGMRHSKLLRHAEMMGLKGWSQSPEQYLEREVRASANQRKRQELEAGLDRRINCMARGEAGGKDQVGPLLFIYPELKHPSSPLPLPLFSPSPSSPSISIPSSFASSSSSPPSRPPKLALSAK